VRDPSGFSAGSVSYSRKPLRRSAGQYAYFISPRTLSDIRPRLPSAWREGVSRPGHKTVPRLVILSVPSSDGCPPARARSCQKNTAGRAYLLGDPRGRRDGAACARRKVAFLERLGGIARCVPWHRACGGRRRINEQFAIGLGAASTRVAERRSPSSTPDWSPQVPPLPELFHGFGTAPLAFQMGVPDAFPFKLWSEWRIAMRHPRRAAVWYRDSVIWKHRAGAASGISSASSLLRSNPVAFGATETLSHGRRAGFMSTRPSHRREH